MKSCYEIRHKLSQQLFRELEDNKIFWLIEADREVNRVGKKSSSRPDFCIRIWSITFGTDLTR